jgi:cytochrome b pre-mRNA-processing protein 3
MRLVNASRRCSARKIARDCGLGRRSLFLAGLSEERFVFAALSRRKDRRIAAHSAYGAIVTRARSPEFYRDWGVPDTLDGRFELLALHAFLVLNRLKREPAQTRDYAQALFDLMFADLDRGVRELGATDIGVGRHVKAMARGFYGRIAAYEKGLGDGAELRAALRRNLFGTIDPNEAQLERAASYLTRQAEAMGEAPVAELLAGGAPFAPLG